VIEYVNDCPLVRSSQYISKRGERGIQRSGPDEIASWKKIQQRIKKIPRVVAFAQLHHKISASSEPLDPLLCPHCLKKSSTAYPYQNL